MFLGKVPEVGPHWKPPFMVLFQRCYKNNNHICKPETVLPLMKMFPIRACSRGPWVYLPASAADVSKTTERVTWCFGQYNRKCAEYTSMVSGRRHNEKCLRGRKSPQHEIKSVLWSTMTSTWKKKKNVCGFNYNFPRDWVKKPSLWLNTFSSEGLLSCFT